MCRQATREHEACCVGRRRVTMDVLLAVDIAQTDSLGGDAAMRDNR